LQAKKIKAKPQLIFFAFAFALAKVGVGGKFPNPYKKNKS
jgi:hypothetical protein